MDDLEALRQLKARYFRSLDTKDWHGLRDTFADDVVFDTTGSGGSVVEGADVFVGYLQDLLGDAVTVHHGHMPELEVTSPTTATGTWALHDILIWPSGTRVDGYGHYRDTYERGGDGWRIKTSTLTRLHLDVAPREGA